MSQLVAVAPFEGMPSSGTGGGIVAVDRDELGIASVIARKGKGEALARRVSERFGIELFDGPRRSSTDNLAFVGIGPGAWIAIHERGRDALMPALHDAIGDLAALVDQSDGYAVLKLSGLFVRETLAKLLPVDLHPSAFAVGCTASTVAAHMSVTLWHAEDGTDGVAFEIAIYRSFALSFWHALSQSAAEFGLQIG
jgi:heterotetrameric sarcosine oxidase gamma subunit